MNEIERLQHTENIARIVAGATSSECSNFDMEYRIRKAVESYWDHVNNIK